MLEPSVWQNGAADMSPDIAYAPVKVSPRPPAHAPNANNIPNVLQCDCLPRD
jgi:hypothetical protein